MECKYYKEEILETIKSVVEQKYENCEILILRKDIANLPEGIEVMESERGRDAAKIPTRELLIHKKGK